MWNACSPGGSPLSETLSRTPAGVCTRETDPTSCPLAPLSAAAADLPDSAAAAPQRGAASTAARVTMDACLATIMDVPPGRNASLWKYRYRLENPPCGVRFRSQGAALEPACPP